MLATAAPATHSTNTTYLSTLHPGHLTRHHGPLAAAILCHCVSRTPHSSSAVHTPLAGPQDGARRPHAAQHLLHSQVFLRVQLSKPDAPLSAPRSTLPNKTACLLLACTAVHVQDVTCSTSP